MQQRKILILTNRVPYPLKDGGNLAMKAMIDGYNLAGWQVFLLSMNTSRHQVSHTILKTIYQNLYAFEWVNINNQIKPLDVVKNFLFSDKPEHAMRFYQEPFNEKLKEVLLSFQPDVVQIESVYLSTYLNSIFENSNAITVLRVHNIEYHIWRSVADKTKNFLKKIYFNSLTKRIRRFEISSWKKYDLLLPITQKDASHIAKHDSPDHLLVAPFGIDIQNIKPSGVPERWVGYHIGAMDWIPNREGIKWFLTDAWKKIQKDLPRFEFYFTGRDMPEEFKKIKLKGVYCLDEVPNAADFIADKKILIVPLWSGSGIRVKILEAMAAGKVVITTAIGIKGIDAKHGQQFLLANRPEDFAKWIKWCIENKQKAEDIGDRAQEQIRSKYDFMQITSSIIAKIDSIFAEKSL